MVRTERNGVLARGDAVVVFTAHERSIAIKNFVDATALLLLLRLASIDDDAIAALHRRAVARAYDYLTVRASAVRLDHAHDFSEQDAAMPWGSSANEILMPRSLQETARQSIEIRVLAAREHLREFQSLLFREQFGALHVASALHGVPRQVHCAAIRLRGDGDVLWTFQSSFDFKAPHAGFDELGHELDRH